MVIECEAIRLVAIVKCCHCHCLEFGSATRFDRVHRPKTYHIHVSVLWLLAMVMVRHWLKESADGRRLVLSLALANWHFSLLLNEATLCHAKTRPEVYFECFTSIIFDYNCPYSYNATATAVTTAAAAVSKSNVKPWNKQMYLWI